MLWVIIAVVLVALLIWGFNPPRARQPALDPAISQAPVFVPLALPQLRPSRHLNSQGDARYLGTRACAGCHPAESASFLETPHSQALGPMGDRPEPVDGSFVHPASSLAFSVVQAGDQKHHRITLDDADGTTLVQCEFPIRYHIGSGSHSISYLLEDDSFLFESPLTWYSSRKNWSLSPGYDTPLPHAFDRIVDQGCLICHAGRVQSRQGNRFQSDIIEETIGCESCHGPGSLHVQRWEQIPRPDKSNEVDLTIVNPSRLGRDQREQICSLCHLRGDATIAIRGRTLAEYRPGLMMSDFRVDYFAKQTGEAMTVTGHVQQMRLSKCYQSSPDMSCITCHSPHGRPAAEESPAYFRQKCLNCHADSCGLASDTRLKQQPDDNCTACHMPRGKTDIPHLAFTHHRIGFHSTEQPAGQRPSSPLPDLVADGSLDHLSKADQLRCLGLAYVEVSEKQSTAAAAQACRETGRKSLQQAHELGVRDAVTLATLAGLAMERGEQALAVSLARASLSEPNADSGGHENARFVLANAYLELNDFASAESELLALVKNRRRVEDWLVLAEVREKRGNTAGALEAVRAAEHLNPFQPDVQRLLFHHLMRAGQTADAERHRRIEQRLLSRLRGRNR